MTITLNADYDVTLNTALLGYVGETNARPVTIEGMEIDGANRYVLTIDYGDGTVYEVDITGGQWTPTTDILRSAQTVSCQIAAKKLSGQEYVLVKKSRIFRLRIGAAIGDTAIPSPDVSMDALDRIETIGRQVTADMQTAVNAADTATTAAENAGKSATAAEKSAGTATQAASRAETAQKSAEKSATQAETAKQGAENARQQAVTAQNNAKISADQASASAKQTTADKTATAGYAQTAKTAADSTTADRQAVQEMAAQVTADKATVADNAAQVAEDRTAAETAAQTAQAVADSLPEDYTTAVGKIAENTADIADVRLTDKELQRRVNALYDIGQGITHQFETDTDTAYAKAVPTGAKLMSVKNVGGRSVVWNQLVDFSKSKEVTAKGVKFTFPGDGIVALNGTCTEEGQAIAIVVPTNVKGHKYLLRANPLSGVYGVNQLLFSSQGYGDDQTGRGVIITNGSSNAKWYYTLYVYNGVTYDSVKLQPQFFDLTAMFGAGNEPASVEEFEKMFPNDYYPYNAGEIISAGVTEVVEQGKNLWDEVWEIGSINSSAGLDTPDSTAIRSKNYTPIIPNSTYIYIFAHTDNTKFSSMKARFYDHNKNYIGYGDKSGASVSKNKAFITPLNAFYVRFTLPPEYGNIYKNDIALIAGSSGEYTPYHRNEYSIPEAIKSLPGYGWSAGTARNYIDYENKKYYQCVDSMDLGTVNWAINSTSIVGEHFYGFIDSAKFKRLGQFGSTVHNILCSKYITVARNVNMFVDKTITLDGDSTRVSQIQVKDTTCTDATTFKQAMSGVILYYELATPIVTDISDLIDDDFLRNIEVEAGGSITFKGSNDSYRIPVPSEEEYIVKLSEIGGSV